MRNKMKKVLLITYYFPPRQSIASIRLRGLAKYLPENGWEPVILTAELPGDPDPGFKVVQTSYRGNVTEVIKKRVGLKPDKRIEQQVWMPVSFRGKKNSYLQRIKNFVEGIIVYPDNQKYWYSSAIESGSKVLKEQEFDAILSSSRPETCHLIAAKLVEQFKLPWVADLRDLWTQSYYRPDAPFRKYFEQKLEIRTLSLADALITVSGPLSEKLETLHSGKKVLTIPNGFDPDDVWESPLTSKFSITYTGGLFEGRRDPLPLFKALRILIEENKVDPRRLQIRFFGRPQHWLDKEIKDNGLENIVFQFGIIPRETALAKQRESQLLMVLNWNDPREEGVYTGKIFEYLAAKRPIIAVGEPGGIVSALLEKTGVGYCASDADRLKEILLGYYKEYSETGKVSYHGKEEVYEYSHKEMAKKFSEVLDNVSAGGMRAGN